MALAPSIIVPLYFYPETVQTFEPLYTAIDTYSQVNFLVIVNPDSGPGSTPSPDENYSREISQLNNRTNVQTIGYIPTGYGSRDISSVLQDISTYNGWPSNGDEGVYVEGVFFDETPNVYTDAIGAFYEQIDGEVKGSSGFQGNKLIVHNPGTLPDEQLAAMKPEVTAIFEQSYELYKSADVQQQLQNDRYDFAASCLFVHSTPAAEIPAVTREAGQRGKYIFVTDLTANYYNSFGPGWGTFVETVASMAGSVDPSTESEVQEDSVIPAPIEAQVDIVEPIATGSAGSTTCRRSKRQL